MEPFSYPNIFESMRLQARISRIYMRGRNFDGALLRAPLRFCAGKKRSLIAMRTVFAHDVPGRRGEGLLPFFCPRTKTNTFPVLGSFGLSISFLCVGDKIYAIPIGASNCKCCRSKVIDVATKEFLIRSVHA